MRRIYIMILSALFVSSFGLSAQVLSVIELIENGDFELGNIQGFHTDYLLYDKIGAEEGERTYIVCKNPYDVYFKYTKQSDHTSGSGYFLFINSDTVDGNVTLRKRINNLQKNKEYCLRFWYAINGGFLRDWYPKLQVLINGEIISGTETISVLATQWLEFNYIYNTGDEDYAEIEIINTELAINPTPGSVSGISNDYGLDDFSFRKVCKLQIDMPDEISICEGDTGRFEVKLSGSTLNEGFMWKPAQGLHPGNPDNPWVDPKVTTTYHLLVIEEGGCEIRDSIKVNVIPVTKPQISISKTEPILCPCETITLTSDVSEYILWEDGSSEAVRVIDKPGIYSVETINPNGCNKKTEIEIKYQSIEINAALDSITAEIGKRIAFPVKMSFNQEQSICQINDYKVRLTYNKSLLVPMDNTGITITSSETLETIEINGNALQGDLNKVINFIATLGTAHCTDLEIEFIDSNCPEITLNAQNGRICLSNVCTQPEDRLFKETNLTGLSQSFPNPAQNTIEINYSLAGDCFAELEFYNSLGESVLKPVSKFHKFGSYKLMLDTKQLPNGIYFYILKANGDTYSRTLVVDNK